MAIFRVLEYPVFCPEEIEILTTAYEEALRALDLRGGDNSITRLVAQKIINLAQTDELDSLRLSTRAIAEFGIANAA
ncbi:MAG: hypothetical protein ACRECV_06925 [Xanthobacteraceae bacterium]